MSELDNPYVGPRTFTQAERGRFFGRDKEARDLLALVLSERLVLFYAQSGAGKSSLLNARLIPALKEDEGFVVLPTGRVSGELPPGVTDVDNIFVFNLLLSLDTTQDRPERFAQMSISDFLAGLVTPDGERFYYQDEVTEAADVVYEEPPHILIIDQFEEILTTHLDRWPEREHFFQQLNQAMLDDPLLWVLLTLREDHVAALQPYTRLMAGNMRARFYMKRMEAPAARQAIEEPARLAGRTFADGVSENLIDDLRQIRVQGQEKTEPGQFVEPVQLQVVCYQLWQNLAGRDTAVITQQDVDELGNVNTSLAHFYEQALATTMSRTGVSEVQLRHWFERELITEAGTRGTVYQGADETAGMSNHVVKALADQYLLRAEIRAGGTWYELVHDRFVEPILQANQAWRLRQSPLLRAAEEWDRTGRPREMLYEGEVLRQAQAAVNRETAEPLVLRFLEESQSAAQARNARRLRVLVAGLLLVVVLVAGLAAFAFVQRAAADTARTVTERLRQVQSLAFVSGRVLESSHDSELASLLALEAYRMSEPNPGESPTPLVDNALRAPLSDAYYNYILHAHTEPVWAVAFSPDGQMVASSGQDDVIRLWDVNAPAQPVATLDGHEDDVRALAFSPDGAWLASGSDDMTVRLWPVRDQTAEPLIFTGHTNWVNVVRFSPDGRFLFSGGDDGTVRQWVISDPTAEPLVYEQADAFFEAIALTPDGRILLAANNEVITYWQVGDPANPDTFAVDSETLRIRALAFSPDGRFLAVAGADDSAITIWRWENREAPFITLEGHTGNVNTLAFSPDGKLLVSAGNDRDIWLWDVPAFSLRRRLSGHRDNIRGVAVGAQGHIASASFDQTVRLWDPTGERAVTMLTSGWDYVRTVAHSADGRYLAAGSDDGLLFFWDLEANTPLSTLEAPVSWFSSLAFSPDGRLLASGDYDEQLLLWNVSDLSAPPELLGIHETFEAIQLAFSPDGSRLASANRSDNTIRLWEVAAPGSEPVILAGHEAPGTAVAFSSDGRQLASGSLDSTIRLWDLTDATAEPLVLRGHEGPVYALAYHPQQSLLASAGADGIIRLWNLAETTAEPQKVLRGHEGVVWDIAFTHDGQRLISAGADRTLRVWAWQQPAEPLILPGHQGQVLSLSIAPDDRTVVSSSDDGTVRRWIIYTEDLAALTCNTLSRNLTVAEWEVHLQSVGPYRLSCPNLP